MAEHSDNIELQDNIELHEEDLTYENETRTTAARAAVEMDEEGHYERLDLQNIDDATYEDLQTKTKKEKDLQKQPDVRRYKWVAVGVGLLCAVLALLNVAVPLYLYQSNMVGRDQQNDTLTEERDKCQSSFDQLMTRYNRLTDQKEELQTNFSQLTDQKEQVQAQNRQLQNRQNQLQNSYNQLTEQNGQLQTSFDQLKTCLTNLCEPGWQKFDRGCYYISTERRTWDQSRQWCRDRQSDLIVIKSKEKQDFVASFNKIMHLGLTDRGREGSFQWVDGTPLTTPTYWMPGEPQSDTIFNRNEAADCVAYYDESQRGGPGWDDIPCSTDFHWICEKVVLESN